MLSKRMYHVDVDVVLVATGLQFVTFATFVVVRVVRIHFFLARTWTLKDAWVKQPEDERN